MYILEEGTEGIIAHRPDQMYGWPGLTVTKDGSILVIASERKYHVCPYGRIVVSRSKDNGNTWSGLSEIYNSLLDDRDGSILTMEDNTVVASWFTSALFCENPVWVDRAKEICDDTKDRLTGSFMLISEDSGLSWEEKPLRMPECGANHIGPYLLPGNRLSCFGYELNNNALKMNFYISEDKGKTWIDKGEINDPEPMKLRRSPCWRLGKYQMIFRPSVNERSLLALDDKRYLAVFRSFDGYLRSSFTLDGGESWSVLQKLPVLGMPPHLLRLSNGDILCTYGYRQEPYSIKGIISKDEGRTWDTENIIITYTWEDKPDMGYPVSAEVSPGEILTVFYSSYARQTLTKEQSENVKEGILFKKFKLY